MMHLFNTILYAPINPDAAVQGSVTGLLLYIILAIGVSFLCSILEAVLLASSQSHVEQLIEQGKRAGTLMQKHKQDVERPISAILTLNTIAHTVGAAGAGAQAAAIFGSQYLGLISAILTLLILILSEIIPKTLGAVYWRILTPFSAYAIQLLVVGLAPAVWVFERLGRLFRPAKAEATVTRADLDVLARISVQEGALLEREKRVLGNLLWLNKVKVEAIMTPRTVVEALPQDMTLREVISEHAPLHYSRIPIYNENIDDIIGYVLRYRILRESALDRHDLRLSDLRQDIYIIPETTTVADILNELVTRQEHIALVTDEFGGTAGIVTLEDAIESLLGIEITDESDTVADLRKLAEKRYQRRLARQTQTGQASTLDLPQESLEGQQSKDK